MANIDTRIVFEKTSFDYVNTEAKVVIVGITPGNTQLEDSREGLSLREIKRRNAFAGNMRPNLVAMLDYIGVNNVLAIPSCATLWEEHFDLVDMTSLLKDATYVLDKNGKKKMFKDCQKIAKSEKLTAMLNNGFVTDQKRLNPVLYVALGPGVYDIITNLKDSGIISTPIVGIAHPSGANSGRIACYLGKKFPLDSSYQWCMDKAIEAKHIIEDLVR